MLMNWYFNYYNDFNYFVNFFFKDYRIDEVQRKILINENVIHSEDKEELEVKLVELENKMAECTDV